MSDRQVPGGPGGTGMGPRRGLLTRNPFLIILFILVGVILLNNVFGPGGQVQIDYSVFRSYVDRMPVVRPDVYQDRAASTPVKAAEDGASAKEGTGNGKDAAEPGGESAPKGAPEKKKAPPPIDNLKLSPAAVTGLIYPDPKDLEKFKQWSQYLDTEGRLPFKTSVAVQDEQLIQDLRARGINFTQDLPTEWTSIGIWVLPILFFLFIVMMMFRSSRMTGENVLSFGRSRAKIVGEEKTGVNFVDVAGADEAKEELSEIVDFLKEPERFTALGGKIPKGVLLMGPPGCGKTLLARAVAGEAGVPFFSISGSDFVEMFVGVGAARVRDLFNTAKQKAPCIIFVDEIDAVGRHRGTGLGGGHDEREQTLNQLLVEMDGFDGRKGVIVIAATNRPDILDPALQRPGRFDRHVVLDAPDLRGREAILRIHSRGKPLQSGVDLSIVARRTPGFSGADLANVMNEAALLAARRNRKDITMREVEEAVERVVAGPERRSRIIGPREKRVLAYHELGHAVVARFSPHADPVHKVSIIPRGKGALGYTLTLPEEDRYILTKDELLSRIRVALGGRSAEEVVFGHQSTGAEDDLQKVTQLARAVVCRWGMTDRLGPVTYQNSPGNPFIGRDMAQSDLVSEKTAAQIDETVREIIEKCHSEAVDIVTANRVLMDRLAEHLIETEMLNLEDFEAAVQRFAETPPPPLRGEAEEKRAGPIPPCDPVAKPVGASAPEPGAPSGSNSTSRRPH